MKEEFRVTREYARLHAVDRVVYLAQGLIEILVRLDGDDRAKNFLAVYLHVRFCPGENGRLDDVVSATASAQEAGSGAHRFVNPSCGTDGVTFADEWADVGGFIHRIAGLQLLDGFDQQVGEFSIDGLFDQNALHGYAGLASIGEAAYDAAFGSIGDISVAVDQDGGIASEFENDLLFPS